MLCVPVSIGRVSCACHWLLVPSVADKQCRWEEACPLGQSYRVWGTQAAQRGLSQGLLDMNTVKHGAVGSFCKVQVASSCEY